jgi:RNase P/RNase MRP subunit p29
MPPFLAKYWIYIAIGVLALGIVGAIYFEGKHAGKSGEVVHEQKQTIQVQKEEGTANENAATARVSDATTAVQQQKDLTDALASSNDPNRQRVLRGCLILRQQHRDTKNIPACGGH